jgi:hypothetical protein
MLRRICFLTYSLVLNQDLQDFEDFLVLGVVWSFESGFTGFRGFFSVGRCLG